jgi:hypothetical protein
MLAKRVMPSTRVLLCLPLLFCFNLVEGLSTPLKSTIQQNLGISFSPAGLLTPYHLGASYELKKIGLLTSSTSVTGASGGALAAVTSALNIDHIDGLAACEYIAERCRAEGTRYTLKVALVKVLEDLLPLESAQILSARDAKCSLAYTGLYRTIFLLSKLQKLFSFLIQHRN